MIIGFACSAWDMLHTGHILALKEYKKHCDYLICALHVDPSIERPEKNKPVQSTYERYIQLSAVKYVDEIIPYQTEQDIIDMLESLEINVRFLGEEYKYKEFTGKNICEQRNISIHFNKRDHRFSSSELRNRLNTK